MDPKPGNIEEHRASVEENPLAKRSLVSSPMKLRKDSRHSEEMMQGLMPKPKPLPQYKKKCNSNNCATPGCLNIKKSRRKFKDKANFYCEVIQGSHLDMCQDDR